MTIEFFCPNEHQLSAPDNMAGKAGKCPRCGSKFLIPTLEELREGMEEPAPEPVSSSGAGSRSAKGKAETPSGSSKKLAWQGAPAAPSLKVGASSGKKSSSDAPTTPAADTAGSDARRAAPPLAPGNFVFLCPNNHKLNGPVSLKGKPGQCPHCGAKFRIPDDDEAGEEGSSAETAPSTTMPSAPSSDKSLRKPSDSAPPDEIAEGIIVDTEPEAEEIPSVEPISVWQLPPPLPGQGHRLAELFSWIWSQREQRCVVELTLKDGQAFAPKWFAAELSVEGYGVFAIQDEFGRFTLTVLPWDSIQRMAVRNLEDIPPYFA